MQLTNVGPSGKSFSLLDTAIRKVLIRQVVVQMTGEEITSLEAILDNLVSQIGDLTNIELAEVTELWQANRDGTPPKYRKDPTEDSYQSWTETSIRRQSLHPSRLFQERGCSGEPDYDGRDLDADEKPVWVSWPTIVVRLRGEWLSLQKAASNLLKAGVEISTIRHWLSRPNPHIFPGKSRHMISRALANRLDILDETPFVSRKGVSCIEAIVHPGLGEWKDEALRMFCRMSRTPLGLRVITVTEPDPKPTEVSFGTGMSRIFELELNRVEYEERSIQSNVQ